MKHKIKNVVLQERTKRVGVGSIGTQGRSYMIASVDRALELLLTLEQNPREMGVTELSKLLGVQKSATHNLLQTLLARGFVAQTDNGRYTLGLRLMRLGAACAERLDVRRIAHPYLRELANETNQIALFGLRTGNEILIVDKAEPPSSFFMIPKFDFSSTFHCSAIGKVLLAYSPEDFVQRVVDGGLAKHTPYTIVEEEPLQQELAKVRDAGFAVACNETVDGVTCLSAPIFDGSGQIMGAFSISSSSATLENETYDSLVRVLKEKTLAVSRALGYLR